MTSSIERLENLVRVSVVIASRRIVRESLHGIQCSTAAFVERSIHGGQDAALCPEADVPPFLVEVEILCIKLIEEVRVAYVQLVRGYADNWA